MAPNPSLTKIGIIGAGVITSNIHLPTLLSVKDARVAWLADRDEKKARTIARSFGVAAARSCDPRDLPDADVVLLAIPFGARDPYYEALHVRGASVYVEKPFARTLDEHDRICSMFPSAGLACGYQKRSLGTAQALTELVRTNTFGALRKVRVEYGGPGVTTGGRYATDLGLAGGGVLFEVGVHALDLALYVAGARSVRVSDVKMQKHAGFDIHTEAVATTKLESGKESELELVVTSLEHTRMDAIFSFEHADITFDLWGSGALLLKPHGSARGFDIGSEVAAFPRSATELVYTHWSRFLEGRRTGCANYTSAAATRITTELVEQLYAGGARGAGP